MLPLLAELVEKMILEQMTPVVARMLVAAVEQEREACARLLEVSARDWPENERVKAVLFSAADAVRARGGEGVGDAGK